jgi:hypothetical protein
VRGDAPADSREGGSFGRGHHYSVDAQEEREEAGERDEEGEKSTLPSVLREEGERGLPFSPSSVPVPADVWESLAAAAAKRDPSPPSLEHAERGA